MAMEARSASRASKHHNDKVVAPLCVVPVPASSAVLDRGEVVAAAPVQVAEILVRLTTARSGRSAVRCDQVENRS